MEKDYVIHLHCTDGTWSGMLRGPEGEKPFRGVDGLLEQLNVAPDPRLERLWNLACTDRLTGLLNRRGLEEEAVRVLNEEEQIALFLLDVDDLKRINDTFGHLRGDLALQKVAQALAGTAGPGDVVGRIGGDEFVMILRSAEDETRLRERGEALCRAVAAAAPEIGLTVSMGACLAGAKIGLGGLLERADRALYQVKQTGKQGFALFKEA